jgi:hypothetical protein
VRPVLCLKYQKLNLGCICPERNPKTVNEKEKNVVPLCKEKINGDF